VQLEHTLVPAELALERGDVIEATGEPRREPPSRLLLGLVELDRKVNVAHDQCSTCVGAEDPDLADPSQIPPFAVRYPREQILDPSCRLRSPHDVSVNAFGLSAGVPVGLVNGPTRRGRVASRRLVLCRSQVRRDRRRGRLLRSAPADR
jgi:hypothetical protein